MIANRGQSTVDFFVESTLEFIEQVENFQRRAKNAYSAVRQKLDISDVRFVGCVHG